MSQPTLTAIAAVARNGVIGQQGRLPWHLPADLRHFKRLTLGGVLLMGRTTFESIGRPLPGRTTVVVSRQAPPPGQPADQAATLVWAGSPTEALTAARRFNRPVWVVGGASIYRAFWPDLTDLEITEVDQAPVGDTVFPTIGPDWTMVERQPYDGYAFVRYHRA